MDKMMMLAIDDTVAAAASRGCSWLWMTQDCCCDVQRLEKKLACREFGSRMWQFSFLGLV